MLLLIGIQYNYRIYLCIYHPITNLSYIARFIYMCIDREVDTEETSKMSIYQKDFGIPQVEKELVSSA